MVLQCKMILILKNSKLETFSWLRNKLILSNMEQPLSNINKLSCRKAMRCNKNINTGTLFDLHKIMRAEVERGMWQKQRDNHGTRDKNRETWYTNGLLVSAFPSSFMQSWGVANVMGSKISLTWGSCLVNDSFFYVLIFCRCFWDYYEYSYRLVCILSIFAGVSCYSHLFP